MVRWSLAATVVITALALTSSAPGITSNGTYDANAHPNVGAMVYFSPSRQEYRIICSGSLIASRLGFRLADGGGDVSGEDGHVRPLRVGEHGRCQVLGPLFNATAMGSPGSARYLPGSRQRSRRSAGRRGRLGTLEDLGDEHLGLVVEERQGPSAAVESATAVLIRPAEALHHAVDRDMRGGRQFHGHRSLLVGLGRRSVMTGPAHRTHRCGAGRRAKREAPHSGHGAAAITASAYSASRSSSWPRMCARNGKSSGVT